MSDKNRDKMNSLTVGGSLKKIEENGEESLSLLRAIAGNTKPGNIERGMKNAMATSQATVKTRDGKGRFEGTATQKKTPENLVQGKTLMGILKGGAKSTWQEKKGTVADIAGRATLGPLWDIGKEVKEAVQSVKEKSGQGTANELKQWATQRFGKNSNVKQASSRIPQPGDQQKKPTLRDRIQRGIGGKLSMRPAAPNPAGSGGGAGGIISTAVGGMISQGLGPIVAAAAPVIGILGGLGAGLLLLKWMVDKGQENQRPLKPGETNAINPVAPADADKTRWRSAIYEPTINNASQKYGVDPNLIKGVVKNESDFNPKAKSRAGAEGLMQLMPATAKELGVTDSTDPTQNVNAGTKHLSRLLGKYSGNETNALQAYNWGEGNMDSYLKTGKGAKGQDMPKETREYAGKVLASKAAFQAGNQTKTTAATPAVTPVQSAGSQKASSEVSTTESTPETKTTVPAAQNTPVEATAEVSTPTAEAVSSPATASETTAAPTVQPALAPAKPKFDRAAYDKAGADIDAAKEKLKANPQDGEAKVALMEASDRRRGQSKLETEEIQAKWAEEEKANPPPPMPEDQSGIDSRFMSKSSGRVYGASSSTESTPAVAAGQSDYKSPPEPQAIQPLPTSIKGMDQVVTAMQAQKSTEDLSNKGKESGNPAIPNIPTEFSDVQLVLMAYDRV